VIPVAGGTILPKVWKAYRELALLGLVEDSASSIHAAQAAGCDPVARAIVSGASEFEPQKPNTIAKSIAIGNPGGRSVRDPRRARLGRHAASASDGEILDAIERLARTEGIFTEPAGGTTLAARSS
jgi:threonine synthase